MWHIFIICVCTVVFFIILLRLITDRLDDEQQRVTIVVLGDIGRSPRMQYHALSFAKEGFAVTVVAYGGSAPHLAVAKNSRINIIEMQEPPAFIQKLPQLFVYMVKPVWQAVVMMFALLFCAKSPHILTQNPPSIPTLAVVWLTSVIRGSHLVVDWHNYGYTILSLAVGPRHVLVRVSKWYETFFGKMSHANICVTTAMKSDLAENWNIRAQTMYDRPPSIFKEADVQMQHDLFMKLKSDYQVFAAREVGDAAGERTAFTERTADGNVQHQNPRPVLLVSSTSWTEDEDFSILLNALQKYEDSVQSGRVSALPDLVCVITGKGPQKAYYQSVIKKKAWKYVQVCTPWLEPEDYPIMLGCADIGVCLHKSSSGLDLPMKVVDMFGCGLPVCAVHYSCLHELVKHEENGMVFHTDAELAGQLQDLLNGFPHGKKLSRLRKNLKSFQEVRWDETWRANVLPLFT